MEELAKKYASLHLAGTYRDVLGKKHHVDDRADIRETWELRKAAYEAIPPDYQKRVADDLKKIEGHIKKIARQQGG